jgi:hypothetical protein
VIAHCDFGLSFFDGLITERKSEDCFLFIAAGQRQRTIVHPHNLAGKAQSDSGSILFGSEERNKDYT